MGKNEKKRERKTKQGYRKRVGELKRVSERENIKS